MKQYTKYHESNKQISMTGARAFLIFEYLSYKPRSFEEIRNRLVECGVANRHYSIDTIRVDLNTLKAIGCEIKKATKKTNYKYELTTHPFKIKISTRELATLKKVYKKIAKIASPLMLLDYHFIFQKLADFIEEKTYKEQVLGISLLKSIDTDILKKLVEDEENHNKIKILYNTSNNKEHEYDITLEKLGLRNNKLYVYCYNHTLKKRSFLNVSRIKEIISKIFDGDSILGLDINVKFKLFNYNDFQLEKTEQIIENSEDYAIIQGRYFNDFIAKQRMLSFGSDCVVIEPEEIKQDIINTLKEMRSVYGRS